MQEYQTVDALLPLVFNVIGSKSKDRKFGIVAANNNTAMMTQAIMMRRLLHYSGKNTTRKSLAPLSTGSRSKRPGCVGSRLKNSMIYR